MTRQSFADVDCGVAQAAQQVGDKWTLVILRDAFNGVNRYDDFARHLGVASNVLATRLSALVDADILHRRPLAGDGRAIEYKLTPKGLELYPLIVFLHQWGDRLNLPQAPRSAARGGRPQDAAARCAPCRCTMPGEPLNARDTRSRIGRGGSDVMQQLQAVVARRHGGSA